MYVVLKPQVHGVAVTSNRQVQVEIHREPDSTTKTEFTIKSWQNNSS